MFLNTFLKELTKVWVGKGWSDNSKSQPDSKHDEQRYDRAYKHSRLKIVVRKVN